MPPSEEPRILLFDTVPESCLRLGQQLCDWGYEVEPASETEHAIAILDDSFHVVIAETTAEDAEEMAFLTAARRRAPETPIIAFSHRPRVGDVLDAIRQGAFDFVLADDQPDALRSAVRRALDHVQLSRENAVLLRDLHRMNALLEERVEERTRLLEDTNQRLSAERVELERTLRTLKDAQTQLVQAEKMASLGLLTAGVAHEINNPLGFVLPNFTVLEEWCARLSRDPSASDPAAVAEMFEVVQECREGILRIRDIVRELGLFSRRSSSTNERVEVKRVIDSVCRLFGGQLRYRSLLRQELTEVPDVRADAGQLRQVVLNLLINAAHAIPEDARDGRITVRTRQCADHVEIDVADNGAGIPPEHLGKVFDPFFTTKPLGKGTGMGLSISRQLIDGMGGKLGIQSVVGEGTTVTITLTAWRDEEALHASAERERGRSSDETATGSRPTSEEAQR